MLLSYPCLCMRISNLDRAHQLIYILSHSSPSLQKYKWHPLYCRVKCYSGIPCACGFIRGSWNTATLNWHLRASSLVMLVGTNTIVAGNKPAWIYESSSSSGWCYKHPNSFKEIQVRTWWNRRIIRYFNVLTMRHLLMDRPHPFVDAWMIVGRCHKLWSPGVHA